MELHVIESGLFKLDGGAMFGVVPKSLWKAKNVPDENNMCTWALRLLLIEDGDRLMLIDTGIGDKQSEKFFSYYFIHGEDNLKDSLNKAGFDFADITDVFLTHLHFDHCGGAIKREGEILIPAFPNATYWSNSAHWKWATQPNSRERASFLKENFLTIEESGQLKHLEPGEPSPFPFMDVIYVDGHTEKMMLPRIKYQDQTIIYCADLLPSVYHIPVPWVMAYDTRPLLTMDEKSRFLDEAVSEDSILFFEHDHQQQCCSLQSSERGVRMKEHFPLSEIL
jgi:glyoxylase-like metal-dependent hydrolase (beta-lactamase superfamily II)